MSELNLVGIPLTDVHSFYRMRDMIGNIYNSMNREHEPTNNHVGKTLNPEMAAFVTVEQKQSFFGTPL
jgi:hypothetical protein